MWFLDTLRFIHFSPVVHVIVFLHDSNGSNDSVADVILLQMIHLSLLVI